MNADKNSRIDPGEEQGDVKGRSLRGAFPERADGWE
jgi:hypothetical protein